MAPWSVGKILQSLIKTFNVTNPMEDQVRRFAMRIKLHRLSGTVVHHCALLRRMLPFESQLIKGYCVSPGDVCEHYWVRVGDLDLDIGYEVACLYTPELRDLQTMLVEKIPDELKHVEVKRQDDNERLYELYITDPGTFWSEAPVDVRRFNPKTI